MSVYSGEDSNLPSDFQSTVGGMLADSSSSPSLTGASSPYLTHSKVSHHLPDLVDNSQRKISQTSMDGSADFSSYLASKGLQR